MSKYYSVRNIKIDVLSMGIFMGAQSMRDNSTARVNSTDSKLDSGSPSYGDSKEGLHIRIALIFMRHLYLKEKLKKPMLPIKDKP